MLNALQKRMKRAALSDALMSSAPASTVGWLAMMPIAAARDARETHHDVGRVPGLHLEEIPEIDEPVMTSRTS